MPSPCARMSPTRTRARAGRTSPAQRCALGRAGLRCCGSGRADALRGAQIHALSSKRSGLVFLLWGKQAQDKAKKGTIQQASKQHVLQSPHPSGLSANKVPTQRCAARLWHVLVRSLLAEPGLPVQGFFGCRHFSQANALLQQNGLAPIDWQIV